MTGRHRLPRLMVTVLAAMVAKLRAITQGVAVLCALLLVSATQLVAAAPYGSGSYSTSCYSADCSSTSNGSSTSNVSTPNTGLQHHSLTLPIVAGVIGVTIVGFVAIRYINRAKPSQ